MAQKVVTACKMKSRQETTSLGQTATVTAKPTISDKHLFYKHQQAGPPCSYAREGMFSSREFET